MTQNIKHLAESVENKTLQDAFKKDMEPFIKLFDRYTKEKKSKTLIDWNKIHGPDPEQLIDSSSLKNVEQKHIRELMSQLVVIKLNGGLGTTMGCKGPKSVIEVRGESTFLDLTVRQIEYLNQKFKCDVPLVLMNSFNTHQDTSKIIKKYDQHHIKVHTFNQKMFPRIEKENLIPLPKSIDPDKFDPSHWYPPGHGDIFDSFYNSPLFKKFIDEGKRYVFISNVDNLGATVDINILNYLVSNQIDYCMEVTKKTRADVKGGTLIQYENSMRLLELAQVAKEHVEEFKSIKKFKIFNTNNIWVNMKSIEKNIKKFENLELIVNKKECGQQKIIQLETACGSAIELFDKAIGVKVSRSRFLPVKNNSDLMLAQSNLYSLQHGRLIFNNARIDKMGEETLPLIKLGDEFKTVSDFHERMPQIPDILELDHLTVSGNVYFGNNVVLKGNVIIVTTERIDIPDGSILENKVITGGLRIHDH